MKNILTIIEKSKPRSRAGFTYDELKTLIASIGTISFDIFMLKLDDMDCEFKRGEVFLPKEKIIERISQLL